MGHWYDCFTNCLIEKSLRDAEADMQQQREGKALARAEQRRLRKREALIKAMRRDM
jgi:hypothetical protein